MQERATQAVRLVSAGCFVCHADKPGWVTPNAQAVAARHHDLTGHRTWCEIALTIHYGDVVADDRQVDLEDSIAALKSGDRPESVPLPVPDAPAARTADVSAPEGRSSRSALAAIQPEHVAP